MRFANPDYLWLLLILPFVVLYLIYCREGDIPRFRFSSNTQIPNSDQNIRKGSGFFRMGILRILCLAALVIGLARPQKGLKSEEVTTKATDIMICLDASRSMLSVDFKPDNRFQVAKNVIMEFIKGREHDRIGMVLFAEHAITQCPLTTDKSAVLNITEVLNVGMIPQDQTAVGVGIATSINRLKNSKAKSKIIILVTDGANNAGSIDPITAAKTAASFGIKIYSIGAASPDGGLMPVDDPLLGRRMVPFKSDLDEDTLLKVASETNGKYFRAKSEDSLKTIFQEIDAMEKTDIKVREFVDYKELYIVFLIAALIFLMIELILNKSVYRTLP